jgi:hypothetical protein
MLRKTSTILPDLIGPLGQYATCRREHWAACRGSRSSHSKHDCAPNSTNNAKHGSCSQEEQPRRAATRIETNRAATRLKVETTGASNSITIRQQGTMDDLQLLICAGSTCNCRTCSVDENRL